MRHKDKVAAFGSCDVLIDDDHHYFFDDAMEGLSEFFNCSVATIMEAFSIDTNNPDEYLKTFAPDEIIYAEKEPIDTIYFIINGRIKISVPYQGILNKSYRTFIGSYEAINNLHKTKGSYKAVGFVKTFCLKPSIFRELVYQLYPQGIISSYSEKENFLRQVKLFNRYLSEHNLLQISQHISVIQLQKGDIVTEDFLLRHLIIIEKGKINLEFCGNSLEDLSATDFIFSKSLFLYAKLLIDIKIVEDSTVWLIDAQVIEKIPICTIKIFESQFKKKERILNIVGGKRLFFVFDGYIGKSTILTKNHHLFIYTINVAYYAIYHQQNFNIFYKTLYELDHILTPNILNKQHPLMVHVHSVLQQYDEDSQTFDHQLIDTVFQELKLYIQDILQGIQGDFKFAI